MRGPSICYNTAMDRTSRKKRPLLRGFIAAAALLLILWIAWGNTALELNEIVVSSDRLPAAFDGFRIAHVSDLHNTEFGEGNGKLLALLAEAEPDLIAITGDMIDSRRPDIDTALRFAEEAVRIAPCCYVTGNHEARVSDYMRLEQGLKATGVTVLRNESMILARGSETIRVLGLDDPGFGSSPAQVLPGLMGEGYNLLLSHRPELFNLYRACGADLTLSGHAHGGQFRLPGVGGIFAPDQGFFPRYDGGLYREERADMVVSRGLGNSLFPFRINNRPEVVLVRLGG